MPLGVIPTPHTVAASATSAVQSDQEHQRKSEAEDGHFAGPFHRDFIDTLIRQKLLPVDVHLFLLSDSGKNDKPADLAKELETARKALAEEQTKVRQLMEERTSILEEAKSAREAVVGADAKCVRLSEEVVGGWLNSGWLAVSPSRRGRMPEGRGRGVGCPPRSSPRAD